MSEEQRDEIVQLEDLIRDLENAIEDLRRQLAFYHDNQIEDPETIEAIEAEIAGLSQSLEKNEEYLNELLEPGENPKPQVDPALAGHLEQLAELANQAGAEGIWIVRGARAATLIYSVDDAGIPVILDLADARTFVLMRFPASDGGEEGIESK